MEIMKYIEAVVCDGENIAPEDLHRKARTKKEVETRQIIMCLALDAGVKQKDAADYFGLDHATANHAKNKLRGLAEIYPSFAEKYETYKRGTKDKKATYLSVLAAIASDLDGIEKKLGELQVIVQTLKSEL